MKSIVREKLLKGKRMALALAVAVLLSALGGCAASPAGGVKLNKNSPVPIEIWHYYNGAQKAAFDQLVLEFNETVGRENGIMVEALNHGNVSELTTSVIDAVNNKVGSGKPPNIFAAYADTADQIDKLGLVADLEAYMTEQEIAEYEPAYIAEGRLGDAQRLKIMPTAKSTEIMLLNKTDWDKFAAATGALTTELSTIEGLAAVAGRYYDWTDAQTPETRDDGKAFFGRDAMANYFIIGSKQLGVDIFSVNEQGKVAFQLEEEVLRKLWDCYYVPYMNGYFAAYGRFRSDDAKVGDVIALVGATTTATFFPAEVIINDKDSYPIEALVLPAPCFEGGEPYAVQQGAGMVVTKATPQEEYASTVFLRWFTEEDRNLSFALKSCYLPVKMAASSPERLEDTMAREADENLTETLRQTMRVAFETTAAGKLYTNKAFEGGTAARKVLEDSFANKISADAEQLAVLLQSGMSRKEAAAQLNTEENFQAWRSDLKQQLEATQKGS